MERTAFAFASVAAVDDGPLGETTDAAARCFGSGVAIVRRVRVSRLCGVVSVMLLCWPLLLY